MLQVESSEITSLTGYLAGFGESIVNGLMHYNSKPCLLLDLERLFGSVAASSSAQTRVTGKPKRAETQRQAETEKTDPMHPIPQDDKMVSEQIGTSVLEDEGSSDREPLIRMPDSTFFSKDPQLVRETSLERKGAKSLSAQREHLISLLAKAVTIGPRRIPGFTPGDPRLSAVAAALVQLPSPFKTSQAAPIVATLLGHTSAEYQVNHFRYDLGKLRARNLAERLGRHRRYRLTQIGRKVCAILADGQRMKQTVPPHAAVISAGKRTALSA
ncbi:MAG: hypothetical protein JSU63_00225 [Phycisphaerales bacterium]|nr:MAG: hypothetical protein JSU63_00225 [Phycisphaerales bacterium]